ncbi:MAG TPA: hypothetical protein VLX30_06175 [Burkholderiales bacterium]|nr:hypothetical protein [Burkholderiales bacterium]
MSDAWKRFDLSGGGLQQANLRLTAALRRRRTAYLLWLAFALGAHRAYLHDRFGAWAYRLASAAALGLAWVDARAAGVVALVVLAAALYDLARLDARITRVNKAIRMRVYLRREE